MSEAYTSDPEWVVQLLAGDTAKAEEIQAAIECLGQSFGVGARDDCRAIAKRMIGRGLLRKVQRETPGWDGTNRVIG